VRDKNKETTQPHPAAAADERGEKIYRERDYLSKARESARAAA